MNESHIRNVIEAALLAAGKPLHAAELVELFDESERPQLQDIQAAITALMGEYSNRGIEVKETAAGFRIQVRREMANEVSRLWPERPAKYSRALLETLALIAYRQPITRAEIEAVRGVAVNPNILKTVIERNWVRVVGHRDVPGRPELLGTTRDFLDYFSLKSLDELPPLAELKTIGDIKVQFDLPDPGPLELVVVEAATESGVSAEAGSADAVGGVGAQAGGADVEGGVDADAVSGLAASGLSASAQAGIEQADGDHEAGDPAAVDHPASDPAAVDHAISGREAGDLAVSAHAISDREAGDPAISDREAGDPAISDPAVSDHTTVDHAAADVASVGTAAPDTALAEAEEFVASLDADLAAGDDDGSDDEELSAAGPGSSELVAGPRDLDE